MGARIRQFYVSARQWYTAQPIPSYQLHDPALANFAVMPEVRAIVELPNEVEVTLSMFQPVVNILPDLIARWHADVKTQMGQILKAAYKEAFGELTQTTNAPDAGTDLDILDDSAMMELATSCFAFSCSCCNKKMFSCQDALAHTCFGGVAHNLDEADLYVRAVLDVTLCRPWSSSSQIVCKNSAATIAQVRAVAQLCGLDWRTVTCREMDQCKERFVCLCEPCTMLEFTRVMDWRYIVSACIYVI